MIFHIQEELRASEMAQWLRAFITAFAEGPSPLPSTHTGGSQTPIIPDPWGYDSLASMSPVLTGVHISSPYT